MIKDSGERRQFETGSIRDTAIGKGRCDLLPLGILADRLNNKIFGFIEDYIRNGDVASLWFAMDEFIGKHESQWYSTILELAKHFENGANKYEERNWEKGQPLHVYIDSGVRHYLQHKRGDADENHAIAFIWNMVCAIWTHENKPELIDLPFATNGAEEDSAPYIGMTDIELSAWCDQQIKKEAKMVCDGDVCRVGDEE